MSGPPPFHILSGCSGGGKSTLLRALAVRGHAVVEEPGRRVLAAGGPKPWEDLAGFARAALEMASQDYADHLTCNGPVFFDRGVIDAAAALSHATGHALPPDLSRHYRFAAPVFLTPPWPEIYETDADRRHGLEEAVAEYDRLAALYAALGYETVILPRTPVAARAEQVLACIGAPM